MKNHRILIVEDDAISVASLRQIVEQMGYMVAGMAATGEEGISLAISENPDVVLMDIRLRGEMSGIEAAEQIRSQSDIPIIYLTAYSEDNLLNEASVTQPYGYLVKPVRDRELRASIETALYKAEADRQLKHLNQMLRSVRNVNQLITREKNRQRLLEEACHILYRVHGYLLVWIGLVDASGEKVTPAAWIGEGENYLELISKSWVKSTGESPDQETIHSRRVVVIQDFSFELRFSQKRENMLAFGIHSGAWAPIMHGERVFGVLCMLSDRINAFSPEELELLQELAGDLGFAIYNIDVEADRNRVVERLSDREARLFAIFRAAPIGIGLVSNRILLEVNEKICEMTGFTQEELVGQSARIVYPTEEEFEFVGQEKYAQIIERGTGSVETRWRKKNGQIIDILLSSTPIDPTELSRGVTFTALDITDRNRATDILRESEQRFRLLVESAPLGYQSLDEDGDLSYVNQAWLDLLGFQREEVIGRWYGDFLTPSSAKNYRQKSSRFKSKGESHDEFEMMRKDGLLVVVDIRGKISYDEKGKFRETHCLLTDVTERRWAEERIQQHLNDLALLDSLNRAVNQGKEIQVIFNLLMDETKRIFHCEGATVYLIEEDYLSMQNLNVSPKVQNQVETLIGMSIPSIKLPLNEDNPYLEFIKSGETCLITEPKTIQQMILAFTETIDLPKAARTAIRKLIKQINRILDIQSIIIVPLIAEGSPLGIIEISSHQILTENEVHRLAAISEQIASILKRKQGEEALKASEERFSLSFQASPIAIVISNLPEGKIVDVNQAFTQMTGYQREETIGRTGLELNLYADPKARSHFASVLRENSSVRNVEGQLITKSGQLREILGSSEIIQLSGEPHVLIMLNDITERKRAEKALQESEQRFQRLAENARDLIYRYEFTPYPCFTSVSLAAASITGYTPEDYYADPQFISKLVHPDDLPIYDKFSKGEVVFHEPLVIRWVRKDGTTIYTEQRIVPVYDDKGNLVALEGIARDITERMRAEEALQESEEKYRNVVERANDGILIVVNSIIRYANQRLAEMWGGALEELFNKPFTDFIHPDELASMVSRYRRRMAGEVEPPTYETILLRKDGTSLPAELNAGLISYQGQLADLVIIRDITRRKRDEQALRESEVRYRSLFEGVPVGLYRTAPDGKILEANPSVIQMLDYPDRQTLLATNAYDIYAKLEDRKSLLDRMERAQGTLVSEMQLQKYDGQVIWVRDILRAVKDDSGLVQYYEGSLEDITERKQAEEELKRRNRELSMLYDTAIAINSHLSLDAVLQTVSEKMIQALDATGCTLSLWKQEENIVETLFDFSILRTGGTIARGETYNLADYPSTRRVLETGDVLVINCNDPAADPVEVALMLQMNEKSMLMLPLMGGDRAIGLVEIYDEGKIRDFIAEETRLARGMASQAAIAIENARLYEQAQQEIADRKLAEKQIQRRAEEFASLYDTARDLAGQTDLHALLQTITRRAGTLLNVQSSGIYLFDSKRGDLEVVATTTPLVSIGTRLALGEGMAGSVANSRKPLIVRDYHTWKGRSPQYEGIPFTSVMGVPMIYSGELIGVLYVNDLGSEEKHTEARQFIEEDARLLSTFASQAASVVYTTRLLEATRQRLAELELLYESGLSFGRLLHPEEMGLKIIEVIGQKMSWHHAALRLHNPDNGTLRLIAFNQPGIENEKDRQAVQDLLEMKVSRIDQGLSGWAVKSGKTIRCADVSQDKHYVETHPNIRSGLYVPLMIGDRILGVISVESEELNAFSETDERLLETLMSQAAIALDNARLLADARRRLNRNMALREIDIVISSSRDLKLTFKSILERTIEHLEVDAADILLLNQSTETLEYAGGDGFRTSALQHTRLPLGEGYAGVAALEKRRIYIPQLKNRKTDFLRSPHFLAESFEVYYAVPLIAKGSVRGVLEVFNRSPILADQEWLDFMETLAGQAAIAIDSITLFNELQRTNAELSIAYDATIEGWSRALDLHDRETEGHTKRVTEITMRLARKMGIRDDALLQVHRGALLHDIGKMGVPDSILNKPGALTDEEKKVMYYHPSFAYEMLSSIVYLRLALDIPYCHHEKWDGTGYPRGLKGEEIPLAARIFAVVDVYDALTSDRPYRLTWSKEKAIEYIREQSGKYFDPAVVKAFLSIFGK